ncbi:SdrD B-like domain-containing protein [Roseovarius aestuariivivens]|uniref:SdrD B-like domain-containing protein n=1 Tax=Roseovarius aestuariivivens TaxID=1888910 RepID=UPI001436BD20|nr:SdrD B-like domain-containing protein [Roseovarius aestuariivivens]
MSLDDQKFVISENTEFVTDLDCGEGENPDLGKDICAVTDKDLNGFGEDTEKPTSYVLSLGELSATLVTQDTTGKVNDKVEVGAVGSGDDGDGSYFIRVSKDSDPTKTDGLFFEGTVAQGDSFEAAGSFGSETFVHIYSSDGGTLLQTINFHTSCSSPLIIGDQYGSITLEGATLEGKDTGTVYTVGQTETDGDVGVVYEITGGNDADDFVVDPDTGEVSFLTPPDYENPTDSDGDNKYDVEVTAFFVDAYGVKTGEICEVKPIEVCVEDDCISILENTNPVIVDLDCGEEENPDLGLDLCVERDALRDSGVDASKLTQLTLSLGNELTTVSSSDQGGKLEVGSVQPGDDGDGVYFIRVSNKNNPDDLNENFFAGTVSAGGSFTFQSTTGGRNEFGSETFVHIFDDDGTFLQTINFHTSCSAPIAIGDQYGSVTLEAGAFTDKGTGALIEYGVSGAPGDAGVVYEITGGNDADDFVVDPDTGEVSFLTPPDYENPTDSDGDNKYDVEVTAFFVDAYGVKTGEICEVKPIEVCVEDELDEVCIGENTVSVINVDLTVDCPKEKPKDVGLEVCAEIERLKDAENIELDKPTELTLTLGDTLSTDPSSVQPSGKSSVSSIFATEDGDGELFVRVTDDDDPTNTGTVYFSGSLQFGETFTALASNAGEDKFSSNTYVHIFDDNGTLLQTIQYHTSCSAPILIGDQVGSVTVTAVGVPDRETGIVTTFGGTETTIETLGEGDIVYSIAGGADSARFTIDTDTGELTFIDAPDYENPQDMGGDNVYDVIVRATAKSDPACFTDKLLEICVEDTPEGGSLSGRYFCDTNDNDQDDNNGDEPGVAGVLVILLNADGTPATDLDGNPVASVYTDANGEYSFDNLSAGTYAVVFDDVDAVTFGKALVTPNVGDDTSDSDAVGTNVLSTIDNVVVVDDADTGDNDVGVEYLFGSLSGRYFVDNAPGDRDTDCDGQDNDFGGDTTTTAVAGALVQLLQGGVVVAETTTDGNGGYTFEGLAAGDYQVRFAADPDRPFSPQDVGDDATDSDVDPTNGTTDTITLAAGEDVSDVDAGVCEKASLGDKVFLDADRDGVQDVGEPGVAGVTVTLTGGGADGVIGTPDDTTKVLVTDGNGEYLFTDLDPGTEYKVTFSDLPAGTEFTLANQGGDDAADSDADPTNGMTQIVTLAPGEENRTLDAGIVEKLASLGDRVFEDLNANGIQDPGESGIAGALVRLLDAAGTVLATDTTDADGLYDFDGLAPGDYRVEFVQPAGFDAASAPNQGGDDAVDSDGTPEAGNFRTGVISLDPGENDPTNDQGFYKFASLGDFVWQDLDGDGIQDVDEPGVDGVTVELKDANGAVIATTTTANGGAYRFDNLTPGTYSVAFVAPAGFAFTVADAGADDALDSDADPTSGMTQQVTLASGEFNGTLDAGLIIPNQPPEPAPDKAAVCSDETVTIDVLANDIDPEGGALNIVAVDGVAITEGDSVTLSGSQAVVTLIGGQLVYDLSGVGDTFDALSFGSEDADSFSYTVADAGGAVATSTVDVKVCGSANSLLTDGIPTTISYEIFDKVPGDFSEAFTVALASADARFDGLVIDEVYCVDAFLPTDADVFIGGSFALATEANADALGLLPEVGDNIDLINYILNQDFTSQDNGDGTSTNYTDLEVQGAIWQLTNGDDFLFGPGGNPGDGPAGTQANVDEIVADAVANGSGFDLGDGSVVAAFLVPTAPGFEDSQPYIVAFECDCDTPFV